MEVFREAVLDRAAEHRLVARGGDLLVVRQAGGVVVIGVHHAECARLAVIMPREVALAAAERFGHHHRDVVGRLGDDGLDGVLDLDRLAGPQAELGGRLLGGVLGDLHFARELDLAGLQALEQQIKRHDLGERGRVARAVGVGLLQHRAGIGVDHDGGVGRVVGGMGAAGDGRGGGGGRGHRRRR